MLYSKHNKQDNYSLNLLDLNASNISVSPWFLRSVISILYSRFDNGGLYALERNFYHDKPIQFYCKSHPTVISLTPGSFLQKKESKTPTFPNVNQRHNGTLFCKSNHRVYWKPVFREAGYIECIYWKQLNFLSEKIRTGPPLLLLFTRFCHK
jgi:hypothetical protein